MLTACVSGPSQQPAWPVQLPAKAVFEQAHRDDAANRAVQSEQEYLKWVKRFYLGWALYPNGWEWLTSSVLRETPDHQKRLHIKEQMYDVGQRIGAEWAKDSRHRYINTAHLMVWGNALKLAIKDGSQLVLASKISADVDALLATHLAPSQIEMSRYFPEHKAVVAKEETDFDDPFDA
ncbi:MAG: hypothetical protein KJO24_00880 [Gammaproteobacteria bacterium]|nr:hypothetical protein [Gammaproteobacteria bacterium]